MRRHLFLLSLLLAATVTGCGDCIPVSLTPEEQSWMRAYQPGQQLTFHSNRGNTNVLTAQPLKEWHDNQRCNQPVAGRYQPIRSTLVLTSATNYGGADSSGFAVLAYKTSPDQPAELTFNLAGLLLQGTDRQTGKKLAPLPHPITLANGRSFPAARLIRSGQNAIHLRGSQIRAAYWAPQTGLLRYELANGEVFDLER